VLPGATIRLAIVSTGTLAAALVLLIVSQVVIDEAGDRRRLRVGPENKVACLRGQAQQPEQVAREVRDQVPS
jgi:hypothetical protein